MSLSFTKFYTNKTDSIHHKSFSYCQVMTNFMNWENIFSSLNFSPKDTQNCLRKSKKFSYCIIF